MNKTLLCDVAYFSLHTHRNGMENQKTFIQDFSPFPVVETRLQYPKYLSQDFLQSCFQQYHPSHLHRCPILTQ